MPSTNPKNIPRKRAPENFKGFNQQKRGSMPTRESWNPPKDQRHNTTSVNISCLLPSVFFFGKWSSYFLSHRIHEKNVCLPTFFTETYGKNVGKSIQFLTHGWVNTLEVLQLRSPRLPQVLEDLGGQGWSVFLFNFDADVFPPEN